ncbi:MAG: RHS repeat-associated core domain-containing protein, partial [Rhodocyclaceae bacterium]|nr:RHS repeat-associated core domain-containing protein [Rhodocyclaceae bacterium]
SGGARTVKTYWPMGLGVEIDRPATGSPPVAPATELSWWHKDRLGSVIAITSDTGIFRERLAFDAWGKRRTLTGALSGTTPTPDTIDGVIDNRGFTGHEMLDQLDLVHMNGRIYDPLTARFMSADPILQDPMNAQSYNRYSYVLNNPTNLTDPTGFASEECASCPTVLTYIGSSSVKVYGEGGTGFSLTGQNDRQTPSDASRRTVAGLMPKTRGSEGFFKVSVKQHPPVGSGESDITKVPTTNYSFGIAEAIAERADQKVQEHGGSVVSKLLATGAFTAAKVIPDNPVEAAVALVSGIAGKFVSMARAALATPAVEASQINRAVGSVADEAFHYTFKRNIASIEVNGLRQGSYATNNGNLSQLQAQIDLALPPNRGFTDSIIRIDLKGLRTAGYEVPEFSQAGRMFNMPGGGLEMKFPYPVPFQFLTVVK